MPDADPTLALALLRAADWFDDALRARLSRDGVRLTRSQAQVFAALDPGGSSIAALARAVGVTRQSMHRTVGELVDLGLLDVGTDPDDARASLVRLTRVGAALVRRAARELREVEAELARRIGARRVAALRDALAADWGPAP
ncbi:MarR family winged helix-turn-helix transcriptional regulator [Aquipuribacter nitratireducens]|uniref:MarR family winged helix-turn-helix transcriptional regulator n=1 Tax=Aquipuribacter nitratireducens TaxID=650104 RepID=A0ABW0GMJ6_9MICO